MKNEAKGKWRDVQKEQFCSGKFNYYFQEICDSLHTEVNYYPVCNNSDCFILKVRLEDSCSILDAL